MPYSLGLGKNGSVAGRIPDFDAEGQHPGFHHYPPAGEADIPEPEAHEPEPPKASESVPPPKKLTVTRVAAWRSRDLTNRGIASFKRAANADGADKSGLAALTYPVMCDFAIDAAVAVALADTLFFSAATGETKPVALYLLITLVPFAVLAPLIGPALDRLQHGRRIAIAASFGLRGLLAIVLVFKFHTWALYPAALGMLVMSKTFNVLRSAVTPRVLPPSIDLVRVNSRLTVFGNLGGTAAAGVLAAGLAGLAGVLGYDRSTGPLWFVVTLASVGAFLSLRIPAHVEVTENEVPATLGFHSGRQDSDGSASPVAPSQRRQPFGRPVITGLWANGTIRLVTGFITLFSAFLAKAAGDGWEQAAILGGLVAAATVGSFAGNGLGARLGLGKPALISVYCVSATAAICVLPALADDVIPAAIATLVAACASSMAKVSLDACIQDDLPAESIASGFGRSETVLQLSWVVGGAFGLFLPKHWGLGFTVITSLAAVGLLQTILTYRGTSVIPGIGGRRPVHPNQELAVQEEASP